MIFMKRNRWCHSFFKMNGVLLVLCFLLSITTAAYARTDAGPFREGSGRMTLLIGGGTAYENNIQYNYTILGGGAGWGSRAGNRPPHLPGGPRDPLCVLRIRSDKTVRRRVLPP